MLKLSDEIEVKRSPDEDSVIDIASSDESLISLRSDIADSEDVQFDMNDNDSNILQDNQTDSNSGNNGAIVGENKFQLLDTFDLTNCFKIVHNVDNCITQFPVHSKPPIFPPNTPGTYLFVVSGNTIANIHDVYSDGLKNWGQQRYYDVGMEKLANGNYLAATRSKKNEFTGRIMQVNHELMDVSKKILSATSTNCKKPGNQTYVAIIYIVRKAFDLPSIPNPPRLKASTSALAENLLHKYTAQGALDIIMQQNFMGNDVNMLPTKNQLEDKARRMEDRKPIKKQGAPKKENREVISKWIHEGHFIRSHYITSETERFLLFTRASQSLLEKSTLSRSVVVSLADEANKLRNNSAQQRLEFAKKLINSKQYVDLQKAGMCFVDTTFTVSRLYLTILLFTTSHILNEENEPAIFIGPMMLHKHKFAADYKWMVNELNVILKCDGRIMRSLNKDGDLALEPFRELKICQDPCQILFCGKHLKDNFGDYCDGDSLVLNDLFGCTRGAVREKGAFDALTIDEFKLNVDKLAMTETWQKYPDLLTWANSMPRLARHFYGYGLLFRIIGGWAFHFATTNALEGRNMLVKSGIKKLALQDAIQHLFEHVCQNLQNAAMSLISTRPYHLKNDSYFIGPHKWASLSDEAKRDALQKIIGLVETSKLNGFKMVICELPHQLLPNLSEVQRMDFVTSARTYQVFNCSPDEPGAFLVTKGEENFKIFSKSIPIICKCMYGKNNISICVHILAIDIKFPDFKIVDQIVKYLEEESEAQRIKRITDQKDGNKQSSSRRTGSKVTRNRKRRIDEIVDTTYSPSNSDTLIEEPGPSLLPLAPSFVRHGNDRLPRPPQLIRHQISHITVIQPASQPIRQPIANRIQRPIRQPIPQSIAQPIPQPIAQPIPRHLVSKQRRADNNPHTTEKEEVREALKQFFSAFPHL